MEGMRRDKQTGLGKKRTDLEKEGGKWGLRRMREGELE